MFTPKNRWQRFHAVSCRNAFHRLMTPEAMRKDLDELKREVAALKKDSHPPFDFDDLVKRLGRLEAIARGEVMP